MAGGFYGMFTPRLDDKGRVTIPARYRKRFADGAMVVRGVTQCLYLFTADEFETFAEDAVNTPVTDTVSLGPARYLMANSDYQTLDAQGRITLNGRMRQWAELGRDVVLTGQGRRMEIWNTERWETYEAEQEAAYVDPSLRATPRSGAGGDARRYDAGHADAGSVDAGSADTAPADTAPTDTAPTDTAPTDTAPTDARRAGDPPATTPRSQP
jgi:MraZ protein